MKTEDYSKMTLKEQDELCRQKASEMSYEDYCKWVRNAKWFEITGLAIDK